VHRHTIRSWLTFALLAQLTLAACGPPSTVRSLRHLPTAVDRDMSVATLVLYDETCQEHRAKSATNCAPREVTARVNANYADCVARGLKGKVHRISVIPGNEFHQRFTTWLGPDYELLTVEKLTAALADPEFRSALGRDGIGYLLPLTTVTRDARRHTTFAASQGAWGIGRESERTTTLTATVLSVDAGASAGDVVLDTKGMAGWVMPVFVIVPLPPVPYGTNTEKHACKALGREVARFLYSVAVPVERKDE
jgi:hypothetical protein